MRLRHVLYLGVGFILLNLTLSFIATIFIPYSGYFSFADLIASWSLPDFIKRFTGFDGLHYINIAQNGYEKNEVAFFPLYPLLIRLLISISTLSFPVVALLISWVSLLMILFLFPRYFSLIGWPKISKWFLIFFLAFPTSFFLQSAYTESLFILLILLTLFFDKKHNTLATFVFGFLAGATRVVGIFLMLPLLLSRRGKGTFLAPVLGFLTYAGYLWLSTGDPLKFFHVQSQFGAGRTTRLILLPQVLYRYLKIFLTADLNYTYFIAALEFGVFMMVLLVLIYDLLRIVHKGASGNLTDRLGLNLFGLAMLIFPTLTGTLLSIPRFALPILTFYLVFADIKNVFIKLTIVGIFSLLHAILLMFFIQGHFVA